METEAPKARKRETAQEAFKRLREQERLEMLEKTRQIEDAQDRARAAVAKKRKKRGQDEGNKRGARRTFETNEKKKSSEPAQPDPMTIPTTESSPTAAPPTAVKSETPDDNGRTSVASMNSEQKRDRTGRGDCGNCCGGFPGKGPGSARNDERGSRCCCSSEIRTRGASEVARPSDGKASRSFSESRGRSEDSRVSRRPEVRRCGRCSPRASITVNREAEVETERRAKKTDGWTPPFDSSTTNEERLRGGCGACGGGAAASPSPRSSPASTYRKQTKFPAGHETTSRAGGAGGCPCGGCGGPACSDNPGGGGADGGCCGGNRPRGKACKCKCQSCDSARPLGGCGGQSCGRIYSCAGSGGGRCCFPRNHKRRSGPDCCGGANTSCGGCC